MTFFFSLFQNGRNGHVFFRIWPDIELSLPFDPSYLHTQFQDNREAVQKWEHQTVLIRFQYAFFKMALAHSSSPLDSPWKTALVQLKKTQKKSKSQNFPKSKMAAVQPYLIGPNPKRIEVFYGQEQRAMQNFKPFSEGVLLKLRVQTVIIRSEYAICGHFGHIISSSLLHFWDIKILTSPLDSPRKTALEQLKKKLKI